jgi:hypothetical protein
MSIEHLEAEALKLPRHIRARLAEALIASLDEDSDGLPSRERNR